jgi:putative ABC transport system permease protein
MALHGTFDRLRSRSLGARPGFSQVPLAWRNLLANKRRLVRSVTGIGFAVLIMMMELGFRNAFLESMLLVIRQLDGDIMLVSSTKYQFDRRTPFSRRQLHEARAVPGVASARPLYAEWRLPTWKNPQDHRLVAVQLLAFDPDQPIFLLPEISAKLRELRQPDTIMVDRRARRDLGEPGIGTETELARRNVKVVGTFSLGPDFFSDGTVVTSDRNFLKLLGAFSPDPADLPRVEVGVIKVLPGYQVSQVQRALKVAMPANVAALTKAELMDQEAQFHSQVSPAGAIFGIGTLIGFAVGLMISYQILFSEISDQLPQYATLKAIGYHDGFLVKVVLQQAVFYGLFGYALAWVLCYLLFRLVSESVLLPVGMSAGLTMTCLVLTIAMCVGAALIAVRRVIAADPAEVF